MTDKFAELEEPRKRTLPAALVVLALMGGFAIHQLSRPRHVELSGLVEPSRAGAGQSWTPVRLDNGRVVKARVAGGGPYVAGDHVEVVEETTLTAAPVYRISGKD